MIRQVNFLEVSLEILMHLDPAQLAALAAILRLGSFDAAAQALGVTPSAISQRLKALEEQVGTTLVTRGTPNTGTSEGLRLAKHAEDVALLQAQALRDIGQADRGTGRVTLAVPADSLGSWPVEAPAAVPELLFDVRIDDQDTSDDWLRRGEVSAAVTGHNRAAPGCDIFALGSMRYIATASPVFVARHFSNGVTAEALGLAPMLTFNAKDRLQAHWAAAKAGPKVHPPAHQVPSTHAFVDAAAMGMAWGMNPEMLVCEHLADGRLVALDPALPLDVPLYWQVTRAMAPALAPLTRAVRQAGARHLLQGKCENPPAA